MPIVERDEKVSFPLSKILESEEGVLEFKRITQDEWIEYSPKFYDLFKAHKKTEEEFDEIMDDLVNCMNAVRDDPIKEEAAEKIEKWPEAVKRGVARDLLLQRRGFVGAVVGKAADLSLDVDDTEVVTLFEKKLVGWNDKTFVDKNKVALPFNPTNLKRFSKASSIEFLMIPSLAFLFEQSDMEVDGAGPLSGNSSIGKNKSASKRT